MDKTRLLHVMDKLSVAGSEVAGPPRQLAKRVNFYGDRWEIRLCNLRRDDAAAELLRRQGVPVVSLARSKWDPLAVFDVLGLIRDWRPDILHLHGYASWTMGRVAGRLSGVPVVVQEHFVDARMPRVQRWMDRGFGGMQEAALAVSEPVREFMAGERHVRGPIEVIWNGVPLDDVASSPPEPERARRLLGISPGRKAVGVVGRLAPMKGHEVFLRAAQKVAQTREDTVFPIVGEGALGPALRRRAEELGIADRVIFTGYQERVRDFLALFDVAVVPSVDTEGFCNVVVEAFTCGTPVVTTDLAAFCSLYRGGDEVLMAPVGDDEALAAGILAVLDDPALARYLAAGGSRAVARFDLRRIAEQYLGVYQRVLAARHTEAHPGTAAS